MWLGIAIGVYLLLMIFGLLFVKGAIARATPPVTDASQPKRTAAGPEIPAAAVNSDILANLDGRASAPTRRLGIR